MPTKKNVTKITDPITKEINAIKKKEEIIWEKHSKLVEESKSLKKLYDEFKNSFDKSKDDLLKILRAKELEKLGIENLEDKTETEIIALDKKITKATEKKLEKLEVTQKNLEEDKNSMLSLFKKVNTAKKDFDTATHNFSEAIKEYNEVKKFIMPTTNEVLNTE
jgi:hypothetical protein